VIFTFLPLSKLQTINMQDGADVYCYPFLTEAKEKDGGDRKRKEINDRVENRTTFLK
jgi:hypothetical protein